jgi:DNA mismatch endonuclease (patch repair protein)
MLANRRRDTGPELALRRELHRRGLRFRVDHAPSEGPRCRIDIAFTRARVAVFVDGCFWHRCPEHGNLPVANHEWWEAKLNGNVDRDRRNDQALESAGWEVIRVWEHEAVMDAADRVTRRVSQQTAPEPRSETGLSASADDQATEPGVPDPTTNALTAGGSVGKW